MAYTNNDSTRNMINKLRSSKGKTELKIYQKSSNYYDEMNYRRQSGTFHFEEHDFSKNDKSISKIYHEVLLSMKFLQTKPQVKYMNINYYDFCYTVIKKRDDEEIVNDESD